MRVNKDAKNEPTNIEGPNKKYRPSITPDSGQIALAKPKEMVNIEPNSTNK